MKKLFAILCMALSLVACDNKQSDKPVVKIGMLYPLSGNAAVFGDTAKMVAKMFFDDYKNTKYK